MKEYILLHKTHHNNYLSIKKGYKNSLSSVFSMLFGGDFRPWDNNFLYQEINLYNAHFIYHDFENKLLYIGFGDWLIDSEIDDPTNEAFPEYVKNSNNCKMSVDNFLEFRQKWIQLKQDLPPYALIYRHNNDWVDCKGFTTQEEMEAFVQAYKESHF